jgi:hypothetical protein
MSWLNHGNRKKKLLLRVCAASIPFADGVTGSYSPSMSNVGMLLVIGFFCVEHFHTHG